MRIAILSDIHGNLEALHAVLADLDALAVDRVVSLGDMVGYGPNPEEVLCALREREIACCLGNHELGITVRSERHHFNATAKKGLKLTEPLLSASSLDYITRLPRFLLFEAARSVHGFPPDQVHTYLYGVDDLALGVWLRRGEAVTFVGHTHELGMVVWKDDHLQRCVLGQESFALSGPCIINVGSVGQPRDGDNRAKYLVWDTLTGWAEVRFVAYDIARTVAKIRARGFPEFYATRLL